MPIDLIVSQSSMASLASKYDSKLNDGKARPFVKQIEDGEGQGT
jgi:hypothetical protein